MDVRKRWVVSKIALISLAGALSLAAVPYIAANAQSTADTNKEVALPGWQIQFENINPAIRASKTKTPAIASGNKTILRASRGNAAVPFRFGYLALYLERHRRCRRALVLGRAGRDRRPRMI